jgi:tetratricopeptide (TPR) repeat protein
MLLSSFVTYGHPMTAEQWGKDEKEDIRLLPMYGNVPKTDKQKRADQQLIDSYVLQEGTRQKASTMLIDIGFDYLSQGDLKTAMSRFNQAWLLDPNNSDVFWGWGSVYFYLRDYARARVQYDEGLSQNPSNPRLLTDKGTLYMGKFYDQKDTSALHTAVEFFSNSFALDSANQNTTYKLSVAYFTLKDCENARKYYDICKQLGGKPISEHYTEALMNTCK